MTTKFFRESYNVTQKEISEKFDIPLSTIKNWDARDCMPSYVWGMMQTIFHQEEKLQIYHEERLEKLKNLRR